MTTLLRAFLITLDYDDEGEMRQRTSHRISRQHPQTIRHNIRRQGHAAVTITEVHQAELRALRTLPGILTSDLGAKLIRDYDEQQAKA